MTTIVGMRMTKAISIVIAGVAVGLVGWAAPAVADPLDCVDVDGGCNVVTPDGAAGAIPGGPAGTAGPGLVQGSIPGGPTGQVTPDHVSGCIPGIGCLDIPR